MDLFAAALVLIIDTLGPSGLFVLLLAALLLHLNDLLGDIRDAREARQTTHD